MILERPCMLGSRYILHDFHLKLISRYIRDSLSGRLGGHLAWESWKVGQITPDTAPRGWLTPAAWNVLHPTRLAFEGVEMACPADSCAGGRI